MSDRWVIKKMTTKKKSFRKRLRNWIFFIVIFAVTGYVLATWFIIFDTYVHPKRMTNDGTPSDFGLDYSELNFKTADGLTLKGWLILPPEHKRQEKMPTVITVHGYSTCRWDILKRSVTFARAGYMVYTYDHRACGDSEGDTSTGGIYEVDDLLLAIGMILKEPATDTDRLALYGFSMGAVSSIIAAAKEERVKLVVADSPYANLREITEVVLRNESIPIWPFTDLIDLSFSMSFKAHLSDVDAEKVVASLSPRPLLILAGHDDTTVPYSHARRIIDAAGPPKKLISFPGHDHHDNGSPEIIDGQVIPFLEEHLGPVLPPEEPVEDDPESEETSATA